MKITFNGVPDAASAITENAPSWWQGPLLNPNAASDALENALEHALIGALKAAAIFLLHLGPGLMTTVCLAAILGGMLGSARCKHWAGLAALATLILKVVNSLA